MLYYTFQSTCVGYFPAKTKFILNSYFGKKKYFKSTKTEFIKENPSENKKLNK